MLKDVTILKRPLIIKNEIFIRRKNKFLLPQNVKYTESDLYTKTFTKQYVATILKNLESLGYTLNGETILEFQEYPIAVLNEFYDNAIPVLKELVGDHVTYTPMYPNFPKQVMEMSSVELYLNAILHYFGDFMGVRIVPRYEKEYRSPLLEKTELRVISLGTQNEFAEMFKQIMSSKTSISETDEKDLMSFFATDDVIILPEEFFHKEIMALVMKQLLNMNTIHEIKYKILEKHIKTATDVLRLATALSDGDLSLASTTNYNSLPRQKRRILLSLLNWCGNIEEDMFRHKMKWIRLGETLHPSEFEEFPKVKEAFRKIRDNVAIERFHSKLENFIKNNKIQDAIDLLESRPGEFARRLDHLLRLSPNLFKNAKIVETFAGVSDKVSTPVLLQVMTHFKHRNDPFDNRIFFPKGNVAKIQVIPNRLEPISFDVCDILVKVCEQTLLNRFKGLESLGNVYLDENLKDYVIPFSQRSAQKAMRTLVRGTKIPIPDGDIVRFFIWWTEKEGNVGRLDIDLSALILKDDWSFHNQLSYTNLKSGIMESCHSGDLTSAPNGASEFIDINKQAILNDGGRFVVMNILSYNGQLFSSMPSVFAGWMSREKVNSGEIFEPKTVQNKVDLTADTKIAIPLILDLKENKVIWADLALKNHPKFANNLEGNFNNLTLLTKSIAEMKKPNLYDLFRLHAEARGQLVEKVVDADFVFSEKETREKITTIMHSSVNHDYHASKGKKMLNCGKCHPEGMYITKTVAVDVTPFDTEKIMSEFL